MLTGGWCLWGVTWHEIKVCHIGRTPELFYRQLSTHINIHGYFGGGWFGL